MTHALTVTAADGLPFVDFEREFDAPVDAVFRAHREPDLIKQWLGPNGYEMHIDHYDFVTGGGSATAAPGCAATRSTRAWRRGMEWSTAAWRPG